MPEVSGIQFVGEVRKDDGLNNATPVVFLTAMQAEVEAEIGGLYPEVYFINKVDEIQSILDIIEKYIS